MARDESLGGRRVYRDAKSTDTAGRKPRLRHGRGLLNGSAGACVEAASAENAACASCPSLTPPLHAIMACVPGFANEDSAMRIKLPSMIGIVLGTMTIAGVAQSVSAVQLGGHSSLFLPTVNTRLYTHPWFGPTLELSGKTLHNFGCNFGRDLHIGIFTVGRRAVPQPLFGGNIIIDGTVLASRRSLDIRDKIWSVELPFSIPKGMPPATVYFQELSGFCNSGLLSYWMGPAAQLTIRG